MPPTSAHFPPRPGSRFLLGAACALVLTVFWLEAQSGMLERLGPADQSPYNRLVEGFQEGRLSLRGDAPPGLARLADPYDPAANQPYRAPPDALHDLSYYRGRLYLYFGLTPALLLFWPWAAATGGFLLPWQGTALFCSIGFLGAAALLRAVWRRYFPEISPGVAAAGALALGLTASAPILVARSAMYEVAISCAYALTTLALGAVWLALHRPAERVRWLAAASVAFGLAAGARPPALFGAAILIVPLAAGLREPDGRRAFPRLLAAAALPLLACGLGLAWYNYQRFGSPWEFGQTYQLATERQDTVRHFSLRYLAVNFRLYFLQPTPWKAGFPFVGQVSAPPLPAGHGPVEDPFGILAAVPLTWLASAAPLAWRNRPAEAREPLRAFLAATALLFLFSALPILLFYWNCSRYELEFLPPVVLLAVIGAFGVDRALAGHAAGRKWARAGGVALLAASVAFNLLAGVARRAQEDANLGAALFGLGRTAEAAEHYRTALRLAPGLAQAHDGLGLALVRMGQGPEAIAEFQAAVATAPGLADARTNLGNALAQSGRAADAVVQYAEVCRLEPESATAHYNLAYGWQLLGNRDAARAEYERASRLNPALARRAP